MGMINMLLYHLNPRIQNAFVDIDEDCINDIVISSYDLSKKNERKLEIWKGV